MKNELAVIKSIDKRLRENKKDRNIFPLTPTHRKELRQLKSKNVGSVSARLRTIKKLKLEEYKKKYYKSISKKVLQVGGIALQLNNDWEQRIIKLNKLINERKDFENKFDLTCLSLDCDWNGIGKLEPLKGISRKYGFNSENIINDVVKKEFNKKYQISFDEVQKRIDDISTKYEEAINFGDLELVKELYYILKSSDNLFEKISNMKI